MKPTKNDIRRRLGLREVPKPPDDLVRRLKADIPPSFRYTSRFSAGRKSELASSAFRGMSWQVAASFLALTVVGAGIYMVTFETEQRKTATIAEADSEPAMEFAPPTAPPQTAAPPKPQFAEQKMEQSRQELDRAYDIPASPPPPPRKSHADASLADGIEGNVAGGVKGGVVGGVPGGVVGGVIGGVVDAEVAATGASADADDTRGREAEAQMAQGRDTTYAEERPTAAASAPAPAAVVKPTRRAAKDETVAGSQPEPAVGFRANEGESVDSLKAKADAGEVLRVGGPVHAPVLIERVEIVYPKKAREARIQGVVILEAVIDRTGVVQNVRVLKPLSMGLDEAAATAVRKWKFKPATLEGKPVDVRYLITVNAKLAR